MLKQQREEFKLEKTRDRNPENKQVVLYSNSPSFTEYEDREGNPWTAGNVFAIDHPRLGCQRVRTSQVLKVYDDDTFETRNTIYVRYPEQDLIKT